MLYFKQNLPTWERTANIVAGLSIISLAILYATTPWVIWVAVAGGIMAAGSGLVGFCPMCAMVGRRLLGGRRLIRAEPRLIEAACGGDAAAVEQLLVVVPARSEALCPTGVFDRRGCGGRRADRALAIASKDRRVADGGDVRHLALQDRRTRVLPAAPHPKKTEPWDGSLDEVLRHQDPLPLDLRKDLTAAIAALPEPYRKVLVLRDIDELTAPEVALS